MSHPDYFVEEFLLDYLARRQCPHEVLETIAASFEAGVHHGHWRATEPKRWLYWVDQGQTAIEGLIDAGKIVRTSWGYRIPDRPTTKIHRKKEH